MPKFLVKATYTTAGARGLLTEGGTARRAAVQKAVEGVGGTLDAFYFTFGADDAVLICDFPDTASGIALSLAVNSTGAVRVSFQPLIAPEEIDAAAKKNPAYRAPGA